MVMVKGSLVQYSRSESQIIFKPHGNMIIIITTVRINRITLPLRLYALERKNVRREKKKRGLHLI